MGDSASRAWRARRYRSGSPGEGRALLHPTMTSSGIASVSVMPVLQWASQFLISSSRSLVGFASRLWSFSPTPFDAAK